MAGRFVAAVHFCNASGQGSALVSHYNGAAHEQHIGLAATQTVIQRENQAKGWLDTLVQQLAWLINLQHKTCACTPIFGTK